MKTALSALSGIRVSLYRRYWFVVRVGRRHNWSRSRKGGWCSTHWLGARSRSARRSLAIPNILMSLFGVVANRFDGKINSHVVDGERCVHAGRSIHRSRQVWHDDDSALTS
jgi:hypothetical protein